MGYDADRDEAIMIHRPVTFFAAVIVLVASLAASAPTGPLAAEKRAPAGRANIELSFAPLVKRVAPAVVNIYTRRVVRTRRSPIFDDPFFRRFFGDDFFGRPRARVQNSLGSGVILRAEGIVVTANHVIDKAEEITVVLSDRREFEATVVLTDERSDLAVLRVDTAGDLLPFLELRDSDELEVGDLVLAIGNPFGVGQTVTSGIVSALARAAQGISDFSFFIQTDAAINPGNSGGALVAMDGRLVGINTAIYSRSGGSLGIGFAIPSNMVATVVASAVKGAKVTRPWFGAAGQEVTADVAAALGLKRPIGVIVSNIYPGGPAARAGLRIGDVITAINGREVASPRALRFRIATLSLGSTAALDVMRQERALKLSLGLVAAPEEPPRNLTRLKGRHPLSGTTVANLSPALAEELSITSMRRGVIVLQVLRGSLANRVGVSPGDLVVRVNGNDIESVAQLKRAVARPSRRWAISVRRDDKVLKMVIEG
jgi:serine protease Do